ncbi:MAG: HPF/RaiA family ribosome-associated protein [Methylibium sp.]|nr:HPF/RaiA family ribosome-associated protein [Methylibium sp.]
MQIQLNTDNHLLGSADLAARLESEVRSSLERFADRITRVEVHLNDLNSDKSGGDDKRCMMEARVAGRQPMSVDHHAPTVDLAISGASDKLVRALDTVFGKLEAGRRSGGRPDNDGAV